MINTGEKRKPQNGVLTAAFKSKLLVEGVARFLERGLVAPNSAPSFGIEIILRWLLLAHRSQFKEETLTSNRIPFTLDEGCFKFKVLGVISNMVAFYISLPGMSAPDPVIPVNEPYRSVISNMVAFYISLPEMNAPDPVILVNKPYRTHERSDQTNSNNKKDNSSLVRMGSKSPPQISPEPTQNISKEERFSRQYGNHYRIEPCARALAKLSWRIWLSVEKVHHYECNSRRGKTKAEMCASLLFIFIPLCHRDEMSRVMTRGCEHTDSTLNQLASG
ncbi:hypothetical protein HNY73_006094 [Argiope bruennichi]|uniref:Uncharacterized protein n=1 Tax=Argiope bruennichi TaxID=94029 RepID=A0A8T0FNK6_ARGBR|nr:hypothetical protein HNY73_006094 [Argiope bruennichi]